VRCTMFHHVRYAAPVQIPIVMYLMTHAYFCFYHAVSNMLLRRVRSAGSVTAAAHDPPAAELPTSVWLQHCMACPAS
jgi:hypothetical protein